MPSWKDLFEEVKARGTVYDVVRREALAKVHEVTGRNAILYYSGWMQKPDVDPSLLSLDDSDKNGFMATIHGLDRSRGLDLILHTPGGDMAATESLVDYLRAMFGSDLRAIVPQLAMSGGTMVALACSEVMMGKHSSLGPIDPQIGGLPAHGIIEEFEAALNDITNNPAAVHVWQPIIAKYSPTIVGECAKALRWANEMVRDWMISGMFEGDPDARKKARRIVKELGDHALTKSHARHISAEKAAALGIRVTSLEADPALQDAVLTVHHASIQSLMSTRAAKIIENHIGVAYMTVAADARGVR